jgi:hypothetical protein
MGKHVVKPFEQCPVCQVPVKWVLHDDANDYDCRNKQCPIHFSEYVHFPKDTKTFDLKNGTLLHFRFSLGNMRLVYGNVSIIVYTQDEFNISKGPGAVIPSFPIDWHNLELMKQKVKTLITFS